MDKENESRLNYEKYQMQKNNDLKEELNKLNKCLNSCINIVSSSVISDKVNRKIDNLKDESDLAHKNIIKDINEKIDNSKNVIKNIKNKQEESSNNNDRRDI